MQASGVPPGSRGLQEAGAGSAARAQSQWPRALQGGF